MQILRAALQLLGPACLAVVSISAQREQVRPEQSRLDLTPFEHEADGGPRAELVPILAGNTVLVSSTLRLFAFEASTGERSPSPTRAVWLGDEILAPHGGDKTPGRRPILDRESGEVRTWLEAPAGTSLTTEQAVFVLSGGALRRIER